MTLGLCIAALGVAAIIGLSEGLRHPAPDDGTLVLDEGDPRLDIECPEPVPREGEPRDDHPATGGVRAVTSSELYDCPQSFDERVVRFRGEVVGAVLRRRGGAWLQLNDDVYAGTRGPLPAHRHYRGGNAGVGVFVPHGLADDVLHVGGPQTRGDVVEVVGRFRRVDPTTREVAIIRADEGAVVRAGAPVVDPVLPDRAVAAGVLALLAGCCGIWERRHARRAADERGR